MYLLLTRRIKEFIQWSWAKTTHEATKEWSCSANKGSVAHKISTFDQINWSLIKYVLKTNLSNLAGRLQFCMWGVSVLRGDLGTF